MPAPLRSLVGKTLLAFKSEHDAGVAQLPRASFVVDSSCIIEVRRSDPPSHAAAPAAEARPPSAPSAQLEGWKRRRFWTWSLLDEGGAVMIRLSTESPADGEARPRGLAPGLRPLPAPDPRPG